MSAVIVKGGRVLSIGYNRLEQHTAAYFGCSFHAEHDAIRKARGNLQGAKMFVYRFSREKDILRPSKPCSFCQQEIDKAKIGTVIFIDIDEALRKASFKDVPSTGSQWFHIHEQEPSFNI